MIVSTYATITQSELEWIRTRVHVFFCFFLSLSLSHFSLSDGIVTLKIDQCHPN